MSLVINTNNLATIATNNLNANQVSLQRSLARLSSGAKIVAPSDDAGGLAVSTKLKAALNRNVRTQQNVDNSISFMQTQDSALKVATRVLDRMSELKTMSLDVTKNSFDIANYNSEFKQLQGQLDNIFNEKFNGIRLFDNFSNLNTVTTEDGTTGIVTNTRNGLFDNLSRTEFGQKISTTGAYTGTDGTDYTSLTFTIPTHGKSATVILADGAVTGSVNGSDITSAIKGINDALAAEGITSISASESYDGKLVITGNETFTVAETITGAYAGVGYGADTAGAAQTYDSVAKTYDFNGLADNRVGDVVTGTRSGGSQESYLITAAVSGTGGSFDEFGALAGTQRLDSSLDPTAKVWTATGTYSAGEVVYDDTTGSYYMSRGDGTFANATTAADATSDKSKFLLLGNALPSATDYNTYDASKSYARDDIIKFDGNLYVSRGSVDPGEGDPVNNIYDSVAATGDWVKLSSAVSGTNNLMDLDNDLQDFSVDNFITYMQTAATTRAQNGAELQRLHISNEMLEANYQNLEAANSRLQDVDIAKESTAFARYNILVQSAASMLAQANAVPSVALQLLQ